MVDREQERAKLVRAAWTVIKRSGYDGFKVRLVMRETGVSARAFYSHFRDKDALVVALIHDEYEATGRRVALALERAGDDPVQQVSAWMREMLLGAAAPSLAPRTRLFAEHHTLMGRNPGDLAIASARILEPLEAAIRRGQSSGVFGESDPAEDARQISRLTGGAINDYLADPTVTGSIDDVISATEQFALRALRL
jgi:AcrR family transcriptional regulator